MKSNLINLIRDLVLINVGLINILYYHSEFMNGLMLFCLGSVLYWTLAEDIPKTFMKKRSCK